jgi:eukaryotic-like serine/threonine-protein kinase
VTTDGPAFAAGIPKHLFDIPGVSVSATHGEFDVTRDGQRFLVTTVSDKAVPQPIEVVVNWR